MQFAVGHPALAIVEPIPIKIEYASRLATIEEVEGGAIFILVQEQSCFEVGRVISVLTHRIFLPWGEIPIAIKMIMVAMTRRTATNAGRKRLRLVKD